MAFHFETKANDRIIDEKSSESKAIVDFNVKRKRKRKVNRIRNGSQSSFTLIDQNRNENEERVREKKRATNPSGNVRVRPIM